MVKKIDDLQLPVFALIAWRFCSKLLLTVFEVARSSVKNLCASLKSERMTSSSPSAGGIIICSRDAVPPECNLEPNWTHRITADPERFVGEAKRFFDGALHALVNNAAVSPDDYDQLCHCDPRDGWCLHPVPGGSNLVQLSVNPHPKSTFRMTIEEKAYILD